MTAITGVLEGLGDRLNPVLVREVRQGLRGRFFLIIFTLTMAFASMASFGVLLLSDPDSRRGLNLFMSCSSFLTFAACYLIPIGAFQSLGSEHDDQTRDLLVLSNLSPGQIIRGKFLSSFLLGLLLVTSVLPFVALSSLMSGVDLIEIASQLAMIVLKCAGFTLVAICLSSLAPSRALRVFLLLVMILFFMISSVGALSFRFMIAGGMSVSPFASPADLLGALMTVLVFGSFAYTLACTRFTHAEENRSTPLRIQVTATIFGLNLLMVAFPSLASGSLVLAPSLAHEVPEWLFYCSLAMFSASALLFGTEPSVLSRRTRIQVPKNWLLALLAFPFFPGGGRAVAWYLGNVTMYLAFVLLVSTTFGSGRLNGRDLQAGFFSVAATMAFFLLLPALLNFLTRRPTGRAWLLSSSLGIVLLGSLIIEPVIEMVGNYNGSPIWRALSPFGVLSQVESNGLEDSLSAVLVVVVLAVVSLGANLARMVRETKELRAASQHMRQVALENA